MPVRIARSTYLLSACLGLTLALLASSAHAQNAEGVHKRFTNDDVISLVQMGLSEDVITTKIRTINSADPGSLAFDTGVDGLKALKAANVPDGVIRVMINPAPAPATVITQAAPMTLDPNLPPP